MLRNTAKKVPTSLARKVEIQSIPSTHSTHSDPFPDDTQPGAALEIKPWHQTYYTAFQTLRSDDNYGDELLIQCHLSGLLCRSIYSHHTWNPSYGETISSTNGDFFAINLTYRNEIDQLQVKLRGKNTVYVRSRSQEICNMSSTPRRDCEGNWTY